jgi:hypothetical protein
VHVHGMEVAPLAPLLIPIGELLLWGVALAVCLGVVYFAKAFFGLAGGLLGKLPVVGGWIDSGLTSIEHKIVSTMSSAAAASDAKVGAAFHELARVIDWIGHEIASHANLIHTLATIITGQAFADQLMHVYRLLTSRIGVIEHDVNIAIRRVNVAEKRLAHGIGADVLPRVKAIEGEFAHVIEHDLASLRARERALEDGALNTFRWIKTHPLALASTAFAGAVAIALQRLGGSWIRCNRWNRIGKQVCGVDANLIEGLLGLTFTALAISDFQELVKLGQTLEHETAKEIQRLLSV